jgi:hypothetical protein
MSNGYKIKDVLEVSQTTKIDILKLLHIKRNKLDNAHITNYLKDEELVSLQQYLISKNKIQVNPKQQTQFKLKNILVKSKDLNDFILKAQKENIKIRKIKNKEKVYLGIKDENSGKYYESKNLGPEYMLDNMFQEKPSLTFFTYQIQNHILESLKTAKSTKELNSILGNNGISLQIQNDKPLFTSTKHQDLKVELENVFTSTYKKSTPLTMEYIETRIKNNLDYDQKQQAFKEQKQGITKMKNEPEDFSFQRALQGTVNNTGDQQLDNEQKRRKRKFDYDTDLEV